MHRPGGPALDGAMAMTTLVHRSGAPAASAGAAVPSAASARAPVHYRAVSSSSVAAPPDVDCDRLPPGGLGLGRPDSCGIATLLKASVIDAAGGLLSLGGGGSEDVDALPEATAVLPPLATDSMAVATSNYLIAGDGGDGTTYANTVESSKKRKRSVTAENEPKMKAIRKARRTKKSAAIYRICSVPGCPKQVQQGGVCCSHGAKTTRSSCSHDGCTNVSKRGGLCRRHGAFDLNTCTRKGCRSVAVHGNFCSVHTETCAKAGCHREATHSALGTCVAKQYAIFCGSCCLQSRADRQRPKTKVKDGAGAENEAGKKTNGPSGSSTNHKRKRTMCKLPGCEKDARARKEGYCCAHFTELVAGVESPIKPKVAAVRKTRGRICSFPGCPKQVQQGGLCCSHGAKCSRGMCSHNGCTNVAKRGGLCRRHGAFDLKTCARKGCKRVAKQLEVFCESCSKEK